MHARLPRLLLAAVAVAVLAVAGIAVNVLLLRYADPPNDPVGKLRPRASITQPTTSTVVSTTADEHDEDEAEAEEPDD